MVTDWTIKITRIFTKLNFIFNNKWLSIEGKWTLWKMTILTSYKAGSDPQFIYNYARIFTLTTKMQDKISLRLQDIGVFYEVFMDQTYLIISGNSSHNGYILDVGAHIGLASIFFKLVYPQTKVIAVEPDANNLKILSVNAQEFEFTIIPKAISLDGKDVHFHSNKVGFNSQINTKGAILTPSLILAELIEGYGNDQLFLIKMDIEGYEKILFDNSPLSWLSKTQQFVMEYHHPESLGKYITQLEECGFKTINSLPNHTIIQASKSIT